MQQATTPTPAQAPAAPAAPAQPAPAAPRADAATPAPRTATSQELNALTLKRGEIQEQLEQLKDRREDLLKQSYVMREGERGPHNERIRIIDQRSANLERELYRVDDQITRALTAGISASEAQAPRVATTTETRELVADRDLMRREINSAVEDAVIGTLAGAGFTLLGLWVVWKGFRRWIWKRKPAAVAADQSVQIAQLQRSIDVVAVEVERIAEANRYVAKLLNDRQLGAGEAQPVKPRARDVVGADVDQR